MRGRDAGTTSAMRSVLVIRASTMPASGSKFSRSSVSPGDWVQDPCVYQNPWMRNPLSQRADCIQTKGEIVLQVVRFNLSHFRDLSFFSQLT